MVSISPARGSGPGRESRTTPRSGSRSSGGGGTTTQKPTSDPLSSSYVGDISPGSQAYSSRKSSGWSGYDRAGNLVAATPGSVPVTDRPVDTGYTVGGVSVSRTQYQREKLAAATRSETKFQQQKVQKGDAQKLGGVPISYAQYQAEKTKAKQDTGFQQQKVIPAGGKRLVTKTFEDPTYYTTRYTRKLKPAELAAYNKLLEEERKLMKDVTVTSGYRSRTLALGKLRTIQSAKKVYAKYLSAEEKVSTKVVKPFSSFLGKAGVTKEKITNFFSLENFPPGVPNPMGILKSKAQEVYKKIAGTRIIPYVPTYDEVSRFQRSQVRGYITEYQEKPIKQSVLFGIGLASGFVGEGVSKVGQVTRLSKLARATIITTPVVKFLGKTIPAVRVTPGLVAGLGLTGLYGYAVGKEVIAAPTIEAKGEILGRKAATLTSLAAGKVAGDYLWLRGRGAIVKLGRRKLEHKEIGQEPVDMISITPKQLTYKELQTSFKKSRLIPPPKRGSAPFDASLPGEDPLKYYGFHVTPQRIGKRVVIGKGTSELPGLYVAPVSQTYFTKVQMAPKYSFFGLNLPRLQKPQIVRVQTLGIKDVPLYVKGSRGSIYSFMEFDAKKGIMYTPRIKAEYESILPAGTGIFRVNEPTPIKTGLKVIETGIKHTKFHKELPTWEQLGQAKDVYAKGFYTKVKGVVVPIDQYKVSYFGRESKTKKLLDFFSTSEYSQDRLASAPSLVSSYGLPISAGLKLPGTKEKISEGKPPKSTVILKPSYSYVSESSAPIPVSSILSSKKSSKRISTSSGGSSSFAAPPSSGLAPPSEIIAPPSSAAAKASSSKKPTRSSSIGRILDYLGPPVEKKPPYQRRTTSKIKKIIKKIEPKVTGFKLFIKRKGIYQEQPGLLPFQKAVKKGEVITTTTLAATFKVEPTKEMIAGFEKPYSPGKEFRPYKIKKGKKEPLEFEWIEEAPFRLGTGSEVREIQAAKKSKPKKSKINILGGSGWF